MGKYQKKLEEESKGSIYAINRKWDRGTIMESNSEEISVNHSTSQYSSKTEQPLVIVQKMSRYSPMVEPTAGQMKNARVNILLLMMTSRKVDRMQRVKGNNNNNNYSPYWREKQSSKT